MARQSVGFHSLLTAATLIAATSAIGVAQAAPHTWESSFGTELTSLAGQDEASEMLTLSFGFPFAGNSYSDVWVGTNGVVTLGSDAFTVCCPTSGDLLGSSAPVIAPFWTDLDLSESGGVYFNDLGDRAVFTWNSVGSWAHPSVPFTFQMMLHPEGGIIFGYNGIPSVSQYLSDNVIVGFSPGGGVSDPGETDYSQGRFSVSGDTVYQVFTPAQHAFFLDNYNVRYTPQNGGYDVAAIPEPGSILLMSAGAGLLLLRWRATRGACSR